MRRQNNGVGASKSTVAATDYVCGGSGQSANDNDDNVNIGSNDDIEDSTMLMMNLNNLREKSQEKVNGENN